MKRSQLLMIFLPAALSAAVFISCSDHTGAATPTAAKPVAAPSDSIIRVDSSSIPQGAAGDQIRYGRELMLNTAYYIGPAGVNGKYLGNKMNCTNCHQDAGTKPFSFSLMGSYTRYPQYRAREGKVLNLAERVNNCIMHPHNGRPLPLDSKEMNAFLAYLKWINGYVAGKKDFKGNKNRSIVFPALAADPQRGALVYKENCARCHGSNGQGAMRADQTTYIYPPLWGLEAYQPGSSMHRIIKMSQWLKSNMPYDRATYNQPFLTDSEALDVSAFVNDDQLHTRPAVKSFDYPHPEEKAIDYDRGPFADSFTEKQHKYGPYPPIIASWTKKGKHAEY